MVNARSVDPPDDDDLTAQHNAAAIARRLVRGSRASLMMPFAATNELRVVAASGLPDGVAATARVRSGDGVSGVVARFRRPLLVNEQHPSPESMASGYRTGSFISVPVVFDDARCGVLSVADPVARQGFDQEDLDTLQDFAAYIASDPAPAAVRRQLRQMEELVSQLRWRAIQAQENERRRVALDLHDEGSHALTAAIFRLDLEAIRLPVEDQLTREALVCIRTALVDCAATLHNIAFAMRPRILEDLGLKAALQSLVNKQAQMSEGTAITLTITGEERRLDEAAELAIFRVVQEALTNVRKHARASHVEVGTAFQPRQLTITVEDDGVGGAAPRVDADGRIPLGLSGMRDRVAAFGGTLTISTPMGGGTRLIATLPLPTRGAMRA